MPDGLPHPDDPDFVATYTHRIEYDRDRAIEELQHWVTSRPDSAPAWTMLATAYNRRLDMAACAEATRKALSLAPDDPDNLHRLAFALMAMNDYEGALEAYRQTHRVTGTKVAATTAALLLHRLGRLDEAARAYAELMANTRPNDREVLSVLRGCMSLLRDCRQPLAADRFAHMLTNTYRLNPVFVASALIERDQASAFHEWLGLVDKTALGRVLMRALVDDPSARTPESFNLPEDRDAFLCFAASQAPGTLYIMKPARGSGGQGISVTDDPAAAAERTSIVVQKYIAQPYLVNGRKGHLRIYALVTSVDPPRAYIYSEGIVRFAPAPYDVRPETLGDVSMHITNTALHADHPGLVISDDETREDEGSIWSVSGLLRHMAAEGHDPDQVFGEISQLIAWFLRHLAKEGLFARQAARGPRRAFAAKLLGFDVLLDQDGHPWLIEMQSSPAARGSALVNRVSAELFTNIFRMTVGVFTVDSMSSAELEAIRTDDRAMAQAELDLELRQQGRFRALDLSP